MKAEIRVLDRVEALINIGWCQKALAQDKQGRCVGVYGVDAVCFCLLGALQGSNCSTFLYEEVKNQLQLTAGMFLHKWNDVKGRTKEDVLELIRKTRKRLMAA